MMLNTTWAEQDLARHEREQEEWLKSRPVCVLCGEHIQDDVYYEPEPDLICCHDCFNDYVRDFIMHFID